MGAHLNYEDRINRVTTYIYDHLDAELDLMRLADVAALSPYHWHRVYHAVRGETIAATVKRLRLQRAAYELSQSTASIEDVAARSGYASVQAFTRAFAEAYGMPPARYRTEGSHAAFIARDEDQAAVEHEVTIRMAPMPFAVGVPNEGSYMNIGRAFGTLYGRLGAAGQLTGKSQMVGIYESDPAIVPEPELKSVAAVFSADGSEAADGLVRRELYPGPYAVLQHKGPYSDMRPAYRWLYGTWLPRSGREAADAPLLEEYRNNPREVAPTDLLTDIYLPLKAM
jgi:AraC family transcriptional regulator